LLHPMHCFQLLQHRIHWDPEGKPGRFFAMPATAASTVRTFKSNVGVPEANRQALIALLNARLADSVDLYSQIKWAHWNVKGSDFIQLHELLYSLAPHVWGQTNRFADRPLTLAGVANGLVGEPARSTGLKKG